MSTTEKYDLIVIGSGPGGYVACLRAARLGLRIVCVEKHARLGGVCLNVGCIPSKALLDSSEYYHLARDHFGEHGIKIDHVGLDLAAMMARKDQVVEELTGTIRGLLRNGKVDVVRGTARLAGPDRLEVTGGESDAPVVLRGDNILLAAGSAPISVPGMEFDGERIVDSTGALGFDEVPGSLGIVGGGYIGLELGSVWRRLGARTTVIEMLPKIAPTLDGQVGRLLDRTLRRQGFEFRLKTRVKEARVKEDQVYVEVESGGTSETLVFDRLLVAVGRRPLTRDLGLEEAGVETDPGSGCVLVDEVFRTNIPSIRAIGDLIPGPMLAHVASAEAEAAVESIAGLSGEVNYDAIPAVIYTWPEAASVGLTEEAVRERGIPFNAGVFPFSGAGRARCMGEKEGFVKLIAHARTDRVLGVHIIGPRAADMIAECTLAVEFGASSEDIARTIHGHPTFSEALQEAAMAAGNRSIYIS
ncbi:MAG: dihydrolipoyl dehydrogenase [Desulfobacterales bacterium]|nr:dihydrolipoyl dehydrogenase [Desulfobacterales bacterium]